MTELDSSIKCKRVLIEEIKMKLSYNKLLVLIVCIAILTIVLSGCNPAGYPNTDTQPRMTTSEANTSPTPTPILIHSPVDGSNGGWYLPATDAYIFPIDPRRTPDEWENAGPNRLSMLQIPDIILKEMTTYGLIETVVNYPYSNDFIAFSPYLLKGIEAISNFNGLKELLGRDDVVSELIRFYSSINIQSLKNNGTGYVLTYNMIELLLSIDDILSRMTKYEKYYMVSAVVENTKHTKAAYIMPYGTMILLGRLLEQVSPSFQSYLQTDPATYEIIRDGLATTLGGESVFRLIDSIFITCAINDNIIGGDS